VAAVTNQMIYDLACEIRDDLDICAEKLAEVRAEVRACRGVCITIQQDINGIYGILARNDLHLDRIERHLGLPQG
jgi:hypothetical protein